MAEEQAGSDAAPNEPVDLVSDEALEILKPLIAAIVRLAMRRLTKAEAEARDASTEVAVSGMERTL